MTTILLTNIKDADGIEIEDHVWFTMGTRFARIWLAPGDTVRFCARVTPYVKGYRGRREDCDLPPVTSDYRLSFPTKIEKVPAAEHHRGVVGPEDD